MTQDGAPGGTDVSGSQGVQLGQGSVQNNTWLPPAPLTPAILAARSPEAGAARIRQLTHDEAVDLFAGTPPSVLAPKLKVLLRSADRQRVVTILADLDASKAAELIGPLATDFPWLAFLPRAAEAIAERAGELEWSHEPGGGGIERAPQSPQGTGGYWRRYSQGCIYWRDDVDQACEVAGAMAGFHRDCGGTSGDLGFPQGGGGHGHSGYADGWGQEFEGGYVFSSSHGTHCLSPEFWRAWPKWLGFPLSAAEARDDFTQQRFEQGVLRSSESGTFPVRPDFAEYSTDAWGLPLRGSRWVPVAPESVVGPVRTQRFRIANGTMPMTLYSSAATGTHGVAGRALRLYERLGGPDSELGLPVAEDERRQPRLWVQPFERGAIYDGGAAGKAIAVPAETIALAGDRLGLPVSPEKAIDGSDGSDGSDGETIQYFEQGVVTRRDGQREMWLRP